jgi:ATP-dependent helicase/nuclease subunit A
VNSYIDALNLVYVAFTRAKSALFIHCKKPKEKRSAEPGKSVNALLEFSLNQMAAAERFTDCWNDEKTVFGYGELPAFESRQAGKKTEWIKEYHSLDFRERTRLRLNSDEFLIPGDQTKSVKNTGKVVHEILAGVIVEDDIEHACSKALAEGTISEAERNTILEKLRRSMKDPVISRWFSGQFTVLNERNLLTDENVLRPDRIMISGKNAVVVDYKWGEKMPGKYFLQVKQYAEILKSAGFEKVEGYIWYLAQDEIEKAGTW